LGPRKGLFCPSSGWDVLASLKSILRGMEVKVQRGGGREQSILKKRKGSRTGLLPNVRKAVMEGKGEGRLELRGPSS